MQIKVLRGATVSSLFPSFFVNLLIFPNGFQLWFNNDEDLLLSLSLKSTKLIIV